MATVTAARPRTTSLFIPSLVIALALPLALAACTGNRAQSYGHEEEHEQEAPHGQAGQVAHAIPQQAHGNADAHGNANAHQTPTSSATPPPEPTSSLPAEPSPDIVYDPPFDKAPVATRKTPSGMIIEDFVIGEGDELTAGATAKIHYTGYLTDGTVFDSSVKRGRPPHGFEVGAGRVIKGWDEGVVGMRRGGKRRLIIPPALGYQQRRAGRIPPNSTLVFTLDLTGFMPPLPEPQPQSVYAGTPVAQEKRPDGLEIYDYRVGDGAVAKAGDTVHVHYRGTLTKDGTEFDASAARRKPITFELGKGRVIKGWDQGIEGMKVGGLRKLVIPAALGYGERARGKIPANADLTFTVELMAVEPAAAPATPAAPTPNPPTPGTPVQ